jgi:uncharacterized delta-60 repeat protein
MSKKVKKNNQLGTITSCNHCGKQLGRSATVWQTTGLLQLWSKTFCSVKILLILLTFYQSPFLFGQAGTVDPLFNVVDDCTFGDGTGLNEVPNSIVCQSNGKILIGGNFTAYQGVAVNRIVRLNADGSIDNTFITGTGFNGVVSAISVQADNKIIIGGFFTSYNGVQVNRIIRLNEDGSIDASFATGAGFDDGVMSIALQFQSQIVICGRFTTYNGATANRIIRLNPNGSMDMQFSLNQGFDNEAACLKIQSDNKIIVGGGFQTYDGISRKYLVRLNEDGLLDQSFIPANNLLNSYVFTIDIQSDGKIVIGGLFNTTISNIPIRHFTRLNMSGNVDFSFPNQNTFPSGGSTSVRKVIILETGKILVFGQFNNYSGNTVRNVIRVEQNGVFDQSFISGDGFDKAVLTACLRSDQKIIIGGHFYSYNGIARFRLIQCNQDGTPDLQFNSGPGFNKPTYNINPGIIRSICVQPDNKIVVAGQFYAAKDNHSIALARLNNDGTIDNSFATIGLNNPVYPTSVDYVPWINGVALQENNQMLLAGKFTTYDGIQRKNIARLNENGTLDLAYNPGTIGGGISNTLSDFSEVHALLIQNDGKAIVGWEGQSKRIARINSDGTIDPSFQVGSGFNGTVKSIALQNDGKIIVVGEFDFYNGTNRKNIARLNSDGSLDLTFTTNNWGFQNFPSFGWKYFDVEALDDGKIIVVGSFFKYNNVVVNGIVKLNNDGTIDNTFSSGTGFDKPLTSIKIQPDNKILVTGYFDQYNNTPRAKIARLNPGGTIDMSFNPGTGFNDVTWALDVQNDNQILVGGDFSEYNGECKTRIARLNGTCDQTTANTITQTACSSFSLNTQTYTQSGTYMQQLTNAQGCDSTITLNLTITQPTSSTITETACEAFTLNNQTYTQSGTYTQQLTNAQGCDSTITLNLTITDPTSSTITETTCEAFTLNNQTYSQSGTYTQQLTNAQGCDSTITLNLTITQPTSSTITETTCEAFTLNNQTYTQSGTYMQQLTNAQGCDSTITLNLTISQPSSSSQTQSAMDSYTWPVNGQTYTQSGVYTAVIPNAAGCDSTITLNLSLAYTGIDDGETPNFNVFPIPTAGSLFIQIQNELINEKFVIMDLMGRIVIDGRLSETTNKFDITGFSSGNYFIKILGSPHVIQFYKL